MAKRRTTKPRKTKPKRQTAASAKKTPIPTPRTIGQIIVDGPHNTHEVTKLERYEHARDAFYAEHFRDATSPPQLLRSAVEQALRKLALIRSDFRHAIQTQHRAESRQRLSRIAEKAKELLNQGKVDSPTQPKPNSTPEAAQLIGSGGFPANACQFCGRYLTQICYSIIYNANRVPRTDKICGRCFHALSQTEKHQYYKYHYGRRPEPRGIGWNPDGEWGK